MAATIRNSVLAVLAAAAVVACTDCAEAQLRFRLRRSLRVAPRHIVVTAPQTVHAIPFLGFDSYFDGSGEVVTSVQYGSRAWNIGLESGDKVLTVNDVPLRYQGHGLQLLQGAAYDGCVRLSIRDWRTGLVAYRTIDLGSSTIAPASSRMLIRPTGRATHRILGRLPR